MSKQSLLDELKQMGELLQAGIISSEEFQKEKDHILAQLRNLRSSPAGLPTPPPVGGPHGGDYWPTNLATPPSQPHPLPPPSQPLSSAGSSPVPVAPMRPVAPPIALQPGMLIARRYRLKRSLGRGGMGQVFLAEDTRWGGDYALKFIAPEWANHPEILRRLQQEYQLLARLSHSSIVRVFDIDHDDEMQLLFFKMEYLEGSALSDLISEAKREIERPLFSFLRTKWWLEQLVSALSYAHQHGVLHRDLKPSNLMISPNDALKVMDFGIARAFSDTHLSQHTSMLGTLHYSAPEILQGGVATPASDVYSFAVILYELLTGILPIGRFEFPSALLQKTAHPLDAIIERALHPRPEHRYPSLALCWKDIEASLSSLFEAAASALAESPPQKNSEDMPLSVPLIHEEAQPLSALQSIDKSEALDVTEKIEEDETSEMIEAIEASEAVGEVDVPESEEEAEKSDGMDDVEEAEALEETHTEEDASVEELAIFEEGGQVESNGPTVDKPSNKVESNGSTVDEPSDELEAVEDSEQIRLVQAKLEALLERDREVWEQTSKEIVVLLEKLHGKTLRAVVCWLRESLAARSVALSPPTQYIRDFFDQGKLHPILDLVVSLSFSTESDAPQKLSALIRSGFTHSLEELDVDNVSLRDENVVLLGSGCLTNLRRLSLAKKPLSIHALRSLAPLSSLRELCISTNADAESLVVLLSDPLFLPNLCSLSIAEKEQSLEHLQPDEVENKPLVLTLDQINAILQSRPNVISLTLPQSLLQIQDQPFSVQQLAVLFQNLPKLKSIHGLLLHDASLSDAEARYIANHPAAAQLRLLSLTHNQITDPGVEALARSPHLSLRHFSLAENPITEAGIQHLIKHPPAGMFGLHSLDLRGCALSRQTVLDLRNAPRIHEIQRLRINKIHSRQRTLTPDQIIEAIDSPGFQEVEVLEFNTNKLGDEGLAILTKSPILSNIRSLSIINNQITDAGIEKILQSPHLGHLRSLNLSDNQITDAGLLLLSQSARLSQLTELSLGSNKITGAGLLALVSSPHIHELKKLVLWKNPIADSGMQALARSPNLARLEELSVWECGISDLGIEAIAESSGLAHLQRLLLANNRITAKGMKALSASQHFSRLRHLSVWKNRIGDEGVLALATSPHLNALQELLLANNQISAKGVKALVEASFCTHLTNLSLTDNPIGDLGAQTLAEAQTLRRLQALHLRNCSITSSGIFAIAQSPHLQHAETIELRGNKLDTETFWSLVYLSEQRGSLRIDEASLSDRWISWHDVDRLARSPFLREFKTHDLSRTNISPAKLKELLNSPYIGKLKALHLEDCGAFDVDEAETQELLYLPACEALQVLNLKGTTDITVNGSTFLAEFQKQRPQLRVMSPALCVEEEATDESPCLDLADVNIFADVEEIYANPDRAASSERQETLFETVQSSVEEEQISNKPPFDEKEFEAYLEQSLVDDEDAFDVSQRQLTNECLLWLAQHPAVQKRDWIDVDVSDNPSITDQGLVWLAESPNLLCLRELNLSNTSVTDQGLAALADSPYARNLESLDFTDTGVTWRGLMQLADSPHLRRLDALKPTFSFRKAGLKPDDVIALSHSRYLLMFEEIDVGFNPDAFSTTRTTRADEVMAALATSPYVKNIHRLDIDNNAIRNSSIFELAKARYFDSLDVLNLSHNQIGTRGLQALLSSRLLAKIEVLFLDGCPIRAKGAKDLAQAKHLTHLRQINLSAMPDSYAVIPAFLEHFEIDHLSCLVMDASYHFPLSNLDLIKKRSFHFKGLSTLSLEGSLRMGQIEALKPLLETEELQGIGTFYVGDKELSRQELEQSIQIKQAEDQRMAEERRVAEEQRAAVKRRKLEERRFAKNRKVFTVAGVEFAVRWIPPGTFLMGSPDSDDEADLDEQPQQEVTISRGFWMMETPVTQGQYQAIMGENPSYFDDVEIEAPVEQVSWYDAAAFANKLSGLEGLPDSFVGVGDEMKGVGNQGSDYVGSKGWRLPTEAEWEYACRAGTTTPRYGDLDKIAWHDDNSEGTTHVVGEKESNAWGLDDMLGNVWEWCYDWYGSDPTPPSTDPIGAETGTERVVRGGSWHDAGDSVRAAGRNHYEPTERDLYGDELGFRLVRIGMKM